MFRNRSHNKYVNMKISIIFPIFNEEEIIPILRNRVEEWIDQQSFKTEVILVNDGSRDSSLARIKDWAAANEKIRVISFSRNFGHQPALTAGLDNATGDATVILDADLQDPLYVLNEMIDKFREGYDVVHAKRISRDGETRFKKVTAWLFYRLFSASFDGISVPDSGDFKLISAKALKYLKSMKEKHRFLRGMYCWVGFKSATVAYKRNERVAGKTKFPLSRMLRFAWDAFLSFSILPIRLISILGFAIAGFGFAYAIYSILRLLIIGDNVQGWTTLVILQSLIGGGILISLGVIGEYVGRVYEEIKDRPLYIIEETIN